jgi:cell volume regulation protein A
LELSEGFKNVLMEVDLPMNSSVGGKKILEIDFPKTSLIVLINREKKYITPTGATELKSGDKLMVMVNSESEEVGVRKSLGLL